MAESLYEIDSKLLEMLERGFNAECLTDEGEIDEAKAAEFLEQIQGQRNDKIEGIALYIKDLKADADKIKVEEAKLKARREAKERKAEVLQDYITSSLLAFGDKKFETARVALSFRKSETVEIADESALPEEYIKATVKYAPDKTALKQALKMGELIDGVRLVEKQNLQIK